MATARPFAINLDAPINGTTQVGNIAIGTNPLNYANLGGATWYMGPDEDLGYIIAAQNGASPTFWRSKLKTEAEVLKQSINNYQKDIDSINVLLEKNKIDLQNALNKLKKGKEQLERTKKEIEKLEKNPIKRTGNELLNSIKEKTK